MNQMDTYLDAFEQKLLDNLLRIAKADGCLGNTHLESEDLTNKFESFLSDYLADAVPQIVDYPTVAIGWAAFVGMGVAFVWDGDVERFENLAYRDFYGPRGFDDLDDHVVDDVLCLKEDEAHGVVQTIRKLAQFSYSAIRSENIEPQSPMAFHVYVRTVRIMFAIGAAMQLYRMGYKMERVY